MVSRVQCLGNAELSLVEAQHFVQSDARQTRNQRDAVTDGPDTADLIEFGTQSDCRRPGARACSNQVFGCGDMLLVLVQFAGDLLQIGLPAIADPHRGVCSSTPAISAGSVRKTNVWGSAEHAGLSCHDTPSADVHPAAAALTISIGGFSNAAAGFVGVKQLPSPSASSRPPSPSSAGSRRSSRLAITTARSPACVLEQRRAPWPAVVLDDALAPHRACERPPRWPVAAQRVRSVSAGPAPRSSMRSPRRQSPSAMLATCAASACRLSRASRRHRPAASRLPARRSAMMA